MMRQNFFIGTSLLLCCLLLAQAQLPPVEQTQLWFDEQLLDHFSPLDTRIWRQRYWLIDQFYEPQYGPILLYICGEYTCPGLPQERLWPAYLAQMFGGLILVVEHRYYGESMPFGDASLQLDKLSYLTVDQALADLAYFIEWIKSNKLHGVNSQNPWITIGGSYPGAMSAWFRYKYPHLTIGALASSAVVNAILNFTAFDEQIRTSALRSGQYCADAIHNVNFYVQDQLKIQAQGAKIKARFNSSNLSDGQFLFYYADIFVELIQYGSRTDLCNAVRGKTTPEVFELSVQYANQKSISPQSYGSYYLSDPTLTPGYTGGRSWTYQYCSEFGWLQTAPDQDPMRGTWVNLTMYYELCTQSFDYQTIGSKLIAWPDVENTNYDLGGLDLQAFNLIFSNGIEDPWQHASLLKSKGRMVSLLINCTDCAHCVDLYTPTENDSPELKEARNTEVYYFTLWLQNYWISQNQTSLPFSPKINNKKPKSFLGIKY